MGQVMNETAYWDHVYKVCLVTYIVISILSFICVWVGFEKPDFLIGLPFEKNSRYNSNPEHAYWVGLLAYIAFPLIVIYFSARAYRVDREPHLYRCLKCSQIFFSSILIVAILFLINGFAEEVGFFSGIFSRTLTGMYFMYFAVWFTFIFCFEWVMISFFEKTRR
jgi:hypothetical protein